MRLKDDERRVMAGMRRGLSFSEAARSLDPQRRYVVARRWKVEGWYASDSHDLYAGRLTNAGLGIKLPTESAAATEAGPAVTEKAEAEVEEPIGEAKDEGNGESRSILEPDVEPDVERVQGQERPDVDC